MMQWKTHSLDPRTRRLHATEAGENLSWQQVLDGWHAGTGTELGRCMAQQPWEACFWECPPLTRNRLSRPWESVLIEAPALASVPAQPAPFDRHFKADADVAVFDNLGGDARLVAPAPIADADFPHLLAFCRQAGPAVQSQLWRAVAAAVDARLDDLPLWLSTSGLGVAWLHVRLDRVPKYYQHQPYRTLPPA